MNTLERSPVENTLRCLSLTQPWASLVMLGKKRIETRSWRTNFRGLLGIHAAKAFPQDARDLYDINSRFRNALRRDRAVLLADSVKALPLGALLGTVQLVDCVPTERVRSSISADELAFGNFDDGRWAWIFEDVKPLPEPIPMRGALGLWATDIHILQKGGKM